MPKKTIFMTVNTINGESVQSPTSEVDELELASLLKVITDFKSCTYVSVHSVDGRGRATQVYFNPRHITSITITTVTP